MSEEFRRRYRTRGIPSAVERQRIRERVLRDAGGLNYDQIEHEFQAITGRLKWPSAATLKDFRHLFSTCLENAGVPEFYRRFFMGQSPGRAPIVTYTHLNELQQQFAKAVQNGLTPLVAAITDRTAQLRLKSGRKPSYPHRMTLLVQTLADRARWLSGARSGVEKFAALCLE